MPTPRKAAFPRLKRRTDRSEGARQWNALRQAVMGLQTSGIRELPVAPAARFFTHFRIEVTREGGSFKGYVGNGYVAGTKFQTGSPFGMELWNQFEVTHETEDIKLDVTAPPYSDGIKELIEAGAGKTLSTSTTYYVYLKITFKYGYVTQNNTQDHSGGCTVVVDTLKTIVTSFETTLKESGANASNQGTSDFERWWLLGVVKTPSSTSYAADIGQLSHAAIYLPPTYRGHGLASGLGYGSDDHIVNLGVTSLTETNPNLSLSASTGAVNINL